MVCRDFRESELIQQTTLQGQSLRPGVTRLKPLGFVTTRTLSERHENLKKYKKGRSYETNRRCVFFDYR